MTALEGWNVTPVVDGRGDPAGFRAEKRLDAATIVTQFGDTEEKLEEAVGHWAAEREKRGVREAFVAVAAIGAARPKRRSRLVNA